MVFDALALSALATSPELARVRSGPASDHWSAGLHEQAERPDLADLADVLHALADGRLCTSAALDEFSPRTASAVPPDQYLRAAQAAEELSDTEPSVAWALAVVALVGWERAVGEGLSFPPKLGSKHFDMWTRLPYVYAKSCLAVRAAYTADVLIPIAISMLWVSTATYGVTDEIRALLAAHARLANATAQHLNEARSNLAEDLRGSCAGSDLESLRAEVAGLAWALGFLPESTAVMRGALPSRAFCRTLVRESVQRVSARDAWLGALWRQLLGRECIDVTTHSELVAVLTADYPASSLLERGPLLPPEEVAHWLVEWCAGRVRVEEVDWFLERIQVMLTLPSEPRDAVDLIRLICLGKLLRDAVAPPPARGTALTDTRIWRVTGEVLRIASLTSGSPARALGLPFFALVDEAFVLDAGSGAVEALLDRLEEYRAQPYQRLLGVNPPLIPPVEGEAGADLLKARAEALEHARTAYVVGRLPTELPLHLQYATIGLGAEPITHYVPEAPEVLARELDRVRSLDQQLATMGYRSPVPQRATLKNLVCALNLHRVHAGDWTV
jgi:hypothetical protein